MPFQLLEANSLLVPNTPGIPPHASRLVAFGSEPRGQLLPQKSSVRKHIKLEWHRNVRRHLRCFRFWTDASAEARNDLGVATSGAAFKLLDGLEEERVTLPRQFEIGLLV